MIRRIIEINEEKCNGCGACAAACHESAIGMVNGKAKLLRDDYCDGLGDCLPQCPTGAIKFVEREAAEYDEAAVLANKKKERSRSITWMPGFTGDETETDEGYYSGRACHIQARTVAVPDQTGSGECPVF